MTSTADSIWNTPESWYAGVDYLTAYWNPVDSDRFPEHKLIEKLHGQIAEGNPERIVNRRGVIWHESGSVGLGRRGDERWYRASGHGAESALEICAPSLSAVRRLDCQITGTWGDHQGECGSRAYEAFTALGNAFGKTRTATLITDNSGGNSCSFGSRTSECYLRIYDHGVKHGTSEPGCCWRFEAELKGRTADRYASLLMSETQRELAAAAITRTLFTDRRIEVPIMARELRTDVRPQEPMTMEKKLRWIEQSVAPSIATLREQGYLQAALEALGLSDHVIIKHK